MVPTGSRVIHSAAFYPATFITPLYPRSWLSSFSCEYSMHIYESLVSVARAVIPVAERVQHRAAITEWLSASATTHLVPFFFYLSFFEHYNNYIWIEIREDGREIQQQKSGWMDAKNYKNKEMNVGFHSTFFWLRNWPQGNSFFFSLSF